MTPVLGLLIGLGVAAIVALVVVKNGQSEAKSVAAAPAKAEAVAKAKLHWLVVRSGPDEGKAFHIGSRRVTVGREASNFVQLSDSALSRTQCQLVPEGDGLAVVDMTSSNGTFVNGKAVAKHVMADGDVLTLAGSSLVYHREGNFDGNAGLGRKSADRATQKTTSVMSGQMARKAAGEVVLLEADGDLDAAAKAMGVSSEEFAKLVKD